MKNKYILYKVARPLIKLYMMFYRPSIKGKENIPQNGRCILAGNHTSNLDALLIMSSTKRNIRFLAKKELFKPIIGSLFLSAGLIPVDRKKKDSDAKEKSLEALNNEELICIFPEGTINRTNNPIIEFKYGAVSFSKKTSSPIVPFIIKGKYKIFKKQIKIEFLKPINIESDDLEKENNKLMNIIKEELIKND